MADSEFLSKKVLITGASGGLGSALVKAFREAGADVLAVSRKPVEGVAWFGADLSDPAAAEAIMAHARGLWPSIDALVNNAGTLGPVGPLVGNDWQAWTQAVQVNLFAPVRLAQLAAAWMIETGTRGSIVNLSGGGATASRPNFSSYAAAKTALVRTTEIMADELAPHGIRVNAIAPGVMKTAMLEEILAAGAEAVGPEHAKVGREFEKGGVDPATPAKLAVYLASARAAAVSGKLISAPWDPWSSFDSRPESDFRGNESFTLRRITPEWAK